MSGNKPIKLAVIGHPISHSLSPVIHKYWLEKYGIAGSYERIDVPPEKLEQFLSKDIFEQGYTGVNVTIPHKEVVFKAIKNLSDAATKIGAVNTVIVRKSELSGDNTDARGFVENIKKNSPKDWSFKNKKVFMLGAGGAAKGICYGLLQEGVSSIVVRNRTAEKAKALQDFFGSKVAAELAEKYDIDERLEGCDLFINTTSRGMKGQKELNLTLKTLPKHALVTDIVYNPLKTSLLLAAEQRGNPTVDGLGMLLYQAAFAFEIWTGKLPEVTSELRARVLEHLK